MKKNILILNVGSSSIKYSLFSGKNLIFKREVEGIGLGKIYFKEAGKEKLISVKTFEESINFVLNDIKNYRVDLIGHRVVQAQ